MTWRTAALLLAALLLWQTWRGCTRSAPRTAPAAECTPAPARSATPAGRATRDDGDGAPASVASARTSDGFELYGFRLQVPSWAWSLLPQSGEHLRAYRDRMLPLARAALAPHRARVARSRDDLAQQLGLDARQRAELDAAARDAAQTIETRLFTAALGGELAPRTFKPMTGVALARDVLEAVDGAGKRFSAALTEDQRTRLAAHPFDFGDYLLFHTRWEDAISGL